MVSLLCPKLIPNYLKCHSNVRKKKGRVGNIFPVILRVQLNILLWLVLMPMVYNKNQNELSRAS